MSDTPVIGIVLGARVRADGSASEALRRRAEHGVKLFHQRRIDRIILSGGINGAPATEASVMRQICLENGMPASRIRTEEKARTTKENIDFSLELLPYGASAVLITDQFHAPRARLIARRLGHNLQADCPALGPVPCGRLAKTYLREFSAFLWVFLMLWP